MAIRVVRSVLSYVGDDIDVVVLDNSDEPLSVPDDLRRDTRLQTVRSVRTLGMGDNWERGLDVASGHYITYVADKDVFLPSAINLFLERLRSRQTDVICYRKGWYCDDRKHAWLYRCDGRLTSASTSPLLDTWLEDPRHLHSAPMVINSAVSRRLVNRIRSRTGRFFVGNSPDVCSGMLLSAHLSEYHQLDRMLSVAHGGAWSLGYAARRFGRNHPNAKAFVAEYGSNPVDALGLPATICSAIVEVILAIHRDHPSAFGSRTINWRRYLLRACQEIDEWEIDERAKRHERGMLRTRKCVVPRSEYLGHVMKPIVGKLLRRIGLLTLAKTVSTVLRPRPIIANIPGSDDSSGLRVQQPWDPTNQSVSTPACSIQQAIELAIELNPPS